SDAGCVGGPSRRHQHVAAGDGPLAAGRPQLQADGFAGAAFDPQHVGPDLDVDLFGVENAPDFLRDVRVLPAQELRPALDDGDAAAEATVRLGEFEAHVAATEDDEVLGQAVDLQKLDVRERPGFYQAGHRRDRGVRADVEENPRAFQHARSAVI